MTEVTVRNWTEKWRPKQLKDIILNKQIAQRLNSIIETKNMTNIVLCGKCGIGKTSIMKCLVYELLGPNADEGLLEINGSDDRGSTAQKLIEIFDKTYFSNTDDYVQHKIIAIDEMDNIKTKVQQAITLLLDTSNTKFIMTCNESINIIEGIQSKSIVIHIPPPTDTDILYRLKHICSVEKVQYTDEGLMSLIMLSDGDIRNAINNLQLVHYGYGLVNKTNVDEICDKPPPMYIADLLVLCDKHKVKEAFKLIEQLLNKGYSVLDIIQTMFITIKHYKVNMDEERKILMLRIVSLSFEKLLTGNMSKIQLYGTIGDLCLL